MGNAVPAYDLPSGAPVPDEDLPVATESSSPSSPPVKYDAALFKQRIGRNPEPTELENFAANKGAGWAGDPGVVSSADPVSTIADRVLGGVARGVSGGYKGLVSLAKGEGAEKAANAVESITSGESQGSPNTAAVLGSPYNPLNYVDEAGQFLGNRASEAGASPGVSTALRMIPDVATSVLGLRGLGKGTPGASTMAEPEAIANAPHPLQGAVDTAADRFTSTRQAGVQAGLKLPDRAPNPQVVASNRMIQDELDLPRQTTSGNPAPVTRKVLTAARDRVAGPAYDNVREVPEFNVSDPYEAEIKGIDLKQISPEMQPPGVNGTMNGDQAVELSRELRAKSSKLYAASKQGHPELEAPAEAHRAAAEAVEDEVSRHLPPEAVQQWDDARTYVAKTYNVEGALDGAGNVVVPKLKAQLMKNKPLSGNIEQLATLGAMYPDSFANRPMVPPPPGIARRIAARVVPMATTAAGGAGLGIPGAVGGHILGEDIAARILRQ